VWVYVWVFVWVCVFVWMCVCDDDDWMIMNTESGMMWMKAAVTKYKVLFRHLPGTTEKRHEYISISLPRRNSN